MKQIFVNYNYWEDYKAGMFNLKDVIDKDKKINDAINLLSNEELFYNTLKDVIINWKISTDVNLTNTNQNRKAWLGAAACMYKYNVPEYLTRIAWNLLTKEIQDKANLIAEKIINEYQNKTNYGKTLFE